MAAAPSSIKAALKQLHFDPAKLSELVEPLTVRVERVEGSARQAMPIPPLNGATRSGDGWTKDNVSSLEQWTLEQYGGGTWIFTVSDAQQPAQVFSWSQVYNIQQYPKKMPVPMSSPSNPLPQMPSTPWSVPGVAAAPSPYVASPFAPQPMPGYPPSFAPQPNFSMMGMMPGPYGFPPQQWSPYPPQQPASPLTPPGMDYRAEAERARLATIEQTANAKIDRLLDENRRLMETVQRVNDAPRGEDPVMKAQLDREREERHKAEIAAANAAMEARIALLTAQKPTGPSEETLRMQKLEDDNRREREERARKEERDRQDAQIKEMRDEARRDREALLATINELKNRPTGPDPLVTVMQMQMTQNAENIRLQNAAQIETARMAAEAQKEQARGQTTLLAELKHYMMGPGEVARLLNDGQQGQHAFVTNMARTFGDAAQVMQGWFSNMVNMVQGPGESPVVRVVEGGIQSAKDMFERWQQSRTQTDVARMQAQASVARAQADAMRPYMPGQMAPVAPNGNGAAPPTPPVDASWQTPPPVSQPGLMGAQPAPTEPSKLRSGGKSDEEWFGPALGDIINFRLGAQHFIDSISMEPMRIDEKKGTPAGVSPAEAAQYILQAAQLIETKKVPVYAFDYLFKQAMYPQLVEVIFPEITFPEYRQETLSYLWGLLSGKSLEQVRDELEAQTPAPQAPANDQQAASSSEVEGDDDGDEDEDGEDGDDQHDGKPAPPVVVPAEVIPRPKTPVSAPRGRKS